MADSGDAGGGGGAVFRDFRSLSATADRKFAKVRDLPPYSRGPHHLVAYRKAFKVYTQLWKFQQERRRDLVAAGLRRWEIGEIASRIGQLYYGQYLRTSEARFLVESYVFYEAILSRGYFESGKGVVDLALRCKELRFYARFLIVAMLLNRREVVRGLVERFRALVEDCRTSFPGTNFKEWKQVLQESVRFLKVDSVFTDTSRPLRYNVLFDSHPSSLPYITRFTSRRVLRLQDAVLTSYHRNEVKFTEVTLDTYRMLQCLEWEPSGSFYEMSKADPCENGVISDHSGASGLIDINLAADMIDSSLPPNPRKAILYHPSILHLIAVLGAITEELSSESILLIYISASGKIDQNQNVPIQKDAPGNSLNSSKLTPALRTCHIWDSSLHHNPTRDKTDSSDSSGRCLILGSRGSGGLNILYPEDLIPFTRRPLFLIIDSDNSHAFKVLHGAERGEAVALLLSPERPSPVSAADLTTFNGSQFTFFLTAPLPAFCQLVGISSEINVDFYNSAETILFSALAEWEVILCTSDSLDQVWAQVLPDPFLRRLILRFIFCRAALSLFCTPGMDSKQSLPDCMPSLPEAVSPNSASTQSCILRLAESLRVVSHFHFSDEIGGSVHNR